MAGDANCGSPESPRGRVAGYLLISHESPGSVAAHTSPAGEGNRNMVSTHAALRIDPCVLGNGPLVEDHRRAQLVLCRHHDPAARVLCREWRSPVSAGAADLSRPVPRTAAHPTQSARTERHLNPAYCATASIRLQRTSPPLDPGGAGFGFGGTRLIGSIFTGRAKSTNPASISSQV